MAREKGVACLFQESFSAEWWKTRFLSSQSIALKDSTAQALNFLTDPPTSNFK